ncbi:MAG: hypothetical protein ABEK50_16270 [bacterium]
MSSTTQGDVSEEEQELPMQTDSFANPLKPEKSVDGEDQLLHFWGRLWSIKKETAAAVYAKFNIDEHELLELPLIVYQEARRLEKFDPDATGNRFKDALENSDGIPANVPNAAIQTVEQKIRHALDSQEQLETLIESLKSKDRNSFKSWAESLTNDIVPSGDYTFQFKGELTTESALNGNATSGSEPKEDQGSSKKESAKESDKKDDRNYKQVLINTSPVKGKSPDDLRPGDTIYIRITGDLLNMLPESLINDEKEDISTPIEADVISTVKNPELPADFDGDSKNYREVRVEFMNGNFGKGYALKDEKVKGVDFDQDNASGDDETLITPFGLIVTGVMIGIVALLAVLIFGV